MKVATAIANLKLLRGLVALVAMVVLRFDLQRCPGGGPLVAVLLVSSFVAGCGARSGEVQEPHGGQQQEAMAQEAMADEQEAIVRLQPTQGYQASGELVLVSVEQGVRLQGSIGGLTPDAKHGFHIHEVGDCSAPDASSAGAHFTLGQEPHGRPSEGEHHLGDMRNLEADGAGEARVDQVVAGARLGDGSPADVFGRAVVVHLAPDDYETQPAGASGARIACGVIERPGGP